MSPQAGWLLQEEVVPRLRAVIPHTVHCVGCEDPEELIQDATAMAAGIFHNAEAVGKKVAASSVAYYSIQHCRSGRRSVGHSCADVHGTATQLHGRTRLHSLEEVVASNEENGGEIFTFNDVLSNEQEDPSTRAARKLDWESFCAGLPERELVAMVLVAEGKTLREAARYLGVSESSMQTSKRRLGVKILEFMGADIMIEVRRRPQWRNSLEATRENPIDEHEVKRLLKDPAWCLQQKFDGRRVLVRKAGAEIHGINRKGLLIGLPSPIVVGAHTITSDFILDGECVGDVLYAFDLLERDGEDCRTRPYQYRLVKLSNLLNRPDITHIEFVETATDPANKGRLFRHLQGERKEGVVFKRLDAPYTPGRPNSGGNQLKHKFYATCSAVVTKINDKRSVELRLLNGKGWIPVGSVTIPPNFKVPAVGDVVEIRFLYAFKESNALYQPVYLGPRKDVEHHECVLSQLKYKGEEEEGDR